MSAKTKTVIQIETHKITVVRRRQQSDSSLIEVSDNSHAGSTGLAASGNLLELDVENTLKKQTGDPTDDKK